MSILFQELDYRSTPIGELSLRARLDPRSKETLYEIKLGDEYLMSSLFTASEEALGRLGVAEHFGDNLQVVVGGLGLGYTARAVLESPRVASLIVVEALEAVIDWHREGLLPLGETLTSDPRCRFVQGNFFEMAASREGFDPQQPQCNFDAVLVDIDHSPDQHLAPENAAFYQPEGLRRLTDHLNPEGIFGLWSNDPVDPAFVQRLQQLFSTARGEDITFHNPLQNRDFTQSVYLGKK